ncbi:MAG: hypothetical protein DRQ13_02860 [Ignavibacteriae bacterium]|nr:MAG: hypothetical protein DRQ13_02860 [Ignavibacteriota bacterium]
MLLATIKKSGFIAIRLTQQHFPSGNKFNVNLYYTSGLFRSFRFHSLCKALRFFNSIKTNYKNNQLSLFQEV